MKFFNLDFHIGVIGDLKLIFNRLGHEVTDWSMSSHAWVLGRHRKKVDIIGPGTWTGIDRRMCDAFYERYARELDQYDAFIVTHTPSFSMLYERWKKPIICVASTRYEAPFSRNRSAWDEFNAFLRDKIDEGSLIPIANNKYDAAYAELFTRRPWKIIPSLCDHTGAHYTGVKPVSLYFSKFKLPGAIENLVDKDHYFRRSVVQRVARKLGVLSAKQGYTWQERASFRSVVFVPYNASIMSIFELYAAGVPMLFPSKQFAARLYGSHRREGVFSELSYNQILHAPSRSIIPCDAPDPNNFEDQDAMMYWIGKSDFYDPDSLRHLEYFDSFDELPDRLRKMDTADIHVRMAEHHGVRSSSVYRAWSAVLNDLECRLGLRPESPDSRFERSLGPGKIGAPSSVAESRKGI